MLSNNFEKIVCFLYSIKHDISLNIYVKQRLLMLVKLDLVNINIVSRALYTEGTVCKRVGKSEKTKESQCGWSTEKCSKNIKKKTMCYAGLPQP